MRPEIAYRELIINPTPKREKTAASSGSSLRNELISWAKKVPNGPFQDSLKELAAIMPEEWASRFSLVEADKNQIIYRQGDPCDRIYILVTGLAEVKHADNKLPFPNYPAVWRVNPGALIGSDYFQVSSTHEHTAIATAPKSLVLAVETDLLVEAQERSHGTNALTGLLIESAGEACRQIESQLEDRAYKTTDQKLAQLLLTISGDNGGTNVPFTHQELADMLGSWRETISKTMGGFREEELLGQSRGMLTILDHKGLKKEAGLEI